MKFVAIFGLYYVVCFLFSFIDAKLSFPMVYKWSKRTKDGNKNQGCLDPTEPFQCPGTDHCISLQFLCDGSPGDCPNNYDEDVGLCVAAKRPPKDTIRRLLMAQYSNYGGKFIEYLFGNKALSMFSGLPHLKAIDIISIALAVSPTIDEFANVIEMKEMEKKRLANALISINTGLIDDLPPFIVNSASEGLGTLANQLIKTHFVQLDD